MSDRLDVPVEVSRAEFNHLQDSTFLLDTLLQHLERTGLVFGVTDGGYGGSHVPLYVIRQLRLDTKAKQTLVLPAVKFLSTELEEVVKFLETYSIHDGLEGSRHV
jgi:hypothetical protein